MFQGINLENISLQNNRQEEVVENFLSVSEDAKGMGQRAKGMEQRLTND